jgi:hypothetical protein
MMVKCILGPLLLLFLFSCEKNTGKYVEKDRIPLLKVGDTILFASNINGTDSFRVTSNSREERYSDKVYQEDFYTVVYKKLNFNIESDLYNRYAVQVQLESTLIGWRNLYKANNINSPSSNKEIKGIVYQKVHLISIDTTYLKSDDVVSVYFSDQEGVLRYELKSGEYYERIN